jgi:hypothetical protein
VGPLLLFFIRETIKVCQFFVYFAFHFALIHFPAKVRGARAGPGLNNAGSGQAWYLHFGLGLFAGQDAYLVKLCWAWAFINNLKSQAPRAYIAQNPGLARSGSGFWFI